MPSRIWMPFSNEGHSAGIGMRGTLDSCLDMHASFKFLREFACIPGVTRTGAGAGATRACCAGLGIGSAAAVRPDLPGWPTALNAWAWRAAQRHQCRCMCSTQKVAQPFKSKFEANRFNDATVHDAAIQSQSKHYSRHRRRRSEGGFAASASLVPAMEVGSRPDALRPSLNALELKGVVTAEQAYEALRLVHAGTGRGASSVHRARHRDSGDLVAIKTYSAGGEVRCPANLTQLPPVSPKRAQCSPNEPHAARRATLPGAFPTAQAQHHHTKTPQHHNTTAQHQQPHTAGD